MRSSSLSGAVVASVLVLLAAVASGSDPDVAGMVRPIEAMEKAIKARDQAQFKAQWVPAGYEANLVGGSGLPGREVYGQATGEGWFLKADVARLHQDGRDGAYLVPCLIWSWEKGRAVDEVWVLPIWDEATKRWLVLGAGEELDEVVALARRYLSKQPLAPAP
jgi:hypothetical protein